MVAGEHPGLHEPSLSEADVARIWQRLTRRSVPRHAGGGAGKWLVAAVLALALGSAATVLVQRVRHDRAAAAADVAEAVQHFEALELPDGSRVRLGPSTQLRLESSRPGAIQLVLVAGHAHFEVTDAAEREFTVAAAGVEVSGSAAGFTVGLQSAEESGHAQRVDMAVDHGQVEVRRLGARYSMVLEAGESWSSAPFEQPWAPSVAAEDALTPEDDLQAPVDVDRVLQAPQPLQADLDSEP